MMLQMIIHKGLDEEISVIIPFMTTQGQLLSHPVTGLFKQFRLQLFFQKYISQPLIY